MHSVPVIQARAEGQLEALVEPHRRALLDLLREDERSVGELVEELGLSQPGVSRHLRVLRETQLVDVRIINGQRRIYSLGAAPAERRRRVDRRYRRFWEERLDAVGT